ncbi:MAG: hypothetical protein P4L10_09895 [Acidobacteriaceae bacterium]|jgi:hypothetical protein|nr:hypothetical protein [Acidobacteriaceae bacterium]
MKHFFAVSMLLLAAHTLVWAQAPPATAATSAPLPPIPALMHEVEIHQQHNEAVAQDYIYNSTVTTRDSKGHTTVEQAEFFYVGGVPLRRVLSRNGKPLPPEDAAKEKARIDKAMAKAKERKEKADGAETDPAGYKLITAARLLELSTVSNERREMLHGRSVIAFDFTGRRDVKTHSIAEALVKSINGTAWIDEKDRQIAKITGTLPEAFHVGWFGLVANISKGSTATAEFTHVRDEVWLPGDVQGQGHVRVFLVDSLIDGTLTVTRSNYRKFGTTISILPAEQPDGEPQVAPAGSQTTPEQPK